MPWELDSNGIHMQASSRCKRCIHSDRCETKRALEVTVKDTVKEMKHGNGKVIVVECSMHNRPVALKNLRLED